MNVKVKLFDKTLPLPAYKSNGAAGADLCARVETKIEPRSIGYIPLNVALEIPHGYWVLLVARGSTHKHGLFLANGIGVGDYDFRGDNDEYHFAAYNFTDSVVTIERGQRIAQMIVMPCESMEIELVESLQSENRGKYGSTGNN